MKAQAVLFDLDGTLVDTAPDLAYALNAVLKENGLSEQPYEQIKPLVAFGGKALIKFGLTHQGAKTRDFDESHPDFIQKHQRFLQIYTHNIDKHSVIFSGIKPLIARMRAEKIFWGVVTNKPENLTHLLLDKLALKPDVVVGGDTLKYNKPHPAPLLYACTKLGILPNNCLFVGDDKNDILAGKNAKIKTVAAAWGYGKITPDWAYNYLAQQPQELEKWIF